VRQALLIVLLLFLIQGTTFGGAVRQTVPKALNHFAFAVQTGASGIARVVKTDIKHPGFFYAYYLCTGEIYQAPFQASDGRLELDFAFWDPGSMRCASRFLGSLLKYRPSRWVGPVRSTPARSES